MTEADIDTIMTKELNITDSSDSVEVDVYNNVKMKIKNESNGYCFANKTQAPSIYCTNQVIARLAVCIMGVSGADCAFMWV